MNYPLISDYVSSILSAEDNFKELTNLRPVLDEEGKPVMNSGNFAVVFKMKDEQSGKLYAVKCFLKEQEGRAESYRQIEEELECVSSNYLTPIRYMEDELFVDSSNTEETEFPILLMDWVEGMTLDKYIRFYNGNIYALSMIAYRFSKMASWLLSQPFAHGDLKCDNIIVKKDGSLVLVDYDGMYVPAMKGQKAREMGSPDFRHPQRTENDFDEHIDDFAITSILLSLKAISLNPDLLRLYGASDRLLFSQKDYLDLSICNVMDALRPLMVDDELNTLLSLFLLAHSRQKLAMLSFQLVNLKKPIENVQRLEVINRQGDLLDSDVQLEMGLRFSYGFGIPKNDEEAVKWYLKSAEQGYAAAQCNLGNCYAKGLGVSQNDSEAINWYLKAAEQGYAAAQNNLGNCYANGRGITQNYSEAVKLYLKAAEQGNAIAQCNLGICYANGRGITQNYSEAVKWYLKAAEQGNAIAQYNLGVCYSKGNGVNQNDSEAFRWYIKSADNGYNRAQFKVGYFYHHGYIVSQNYKEAEQWYLKASSQNNEQAIVALKELGYLLKAQVTNEDIAEGIEDEYGCVYSKDGTRLLKVKTIEEKQHERPMWSFDSDYLYFPFKTYTIKLNTEIICNKAFEHCKGLESVILPNSIKYIGENAFSGCHDINALQIPNGVIGIGMYAFKDCKKLKQINISTNMNVLQDSIFEGCSSLSNVLIPDNIQEIIGNPFACCNCIIENQSKCFSISNKGNLYSSNYKKLISYYSKDEEYEVLKSVKEIGDKSLAGCNLKKIIIPSTVSFINRNAFYKGYIENMIVHCSIYSFNNLALYGSTIDQIMFENYPKDDKKFNDLMKSYKEYQMNGNSFYGDSVEIKKESITKIVLNHETSWIV